MSREYGEPTTAGNLIADDKNIIPYRKNLNELTGSVTATILLGQAMYWDKKMGGEFYKFITPCKHNLYKENESWTEELGFTKYQFRSAIKKIGFKRGKSKNDIENEEDAYIIYYTDSSRVTWWFINWNKLNKDLDALYTDISLSRKNQNTKETGNKQDTKEMVNNQNTITTETTSETSFTETTKGKREGNVVSSYVFSDNEIQNHLINEYSNYEWITENVEFYLDIYEKAMGEAHPQMKLNEWDRVFMNITHAYDDREYGKEAEMLGDTFRKVVIQHFNTHYQQGCDYRLLHFVSGNIMINRYYEIF